MLTGSQKQRLQILATSQKFGKLIEDAIKTWETADVLFGNFGIVRPDPSLTNGQIELSNNSKCCLLGASLVGKEMVCADELFADAIKRIYNVNAESIWRGFDCGYDNLHDRDKNNEDFMFGYKVRKILLDKSEE